MRTFAQTLRSLALLPLILAAATAKSTVAQVNLVDETVAGYDDSWQTKTEVETCDCDSPFGTFECPCGVRLDCKALRHELHLEISGPDEQGVRSVVTDCANQAIQAGVVGGVATIWTGGGALAAAAETAKDYMLACLGEQAATNVSIGFTDRSHWTDWGPCL
jgi:hypothetical protein